MNQIRFDTFVFIVNFLDRDWVYCHVIVDLFEDVDICGITLVELGKPLLVELQLTNKVLACVKDKGKNLATLNFSMSIVVSCHVLQLEKAFFGTCFRHVTSKVYQYATNEKRFVKA